MEGSDKQRCLFTLVISSNPLSFFSFLISSFGECIFLFVINVCGLADFRVNYCYTKFESGRCQAPKPLNTTKEVCCCTGMPGQGWGDPCEICPSKGEGEHVPVPGEDGNTPIPCLCPVQQYFSFVCVSRGLSSSLP